MTFGLPIAGQTIAMVFGIAAALAVIAYILKMRRRRFEVPFGTLWQRVLKERETTSLWRHLRRLLSLLLILAMIGVLAAATTDPLLGRADESARNVVLIVDASASMRTEDETLSGKDGAQTRLARAKAEALELVGSLGGGDAVMVMRMDGQSTPLSRFESDPDRVRTVIRDIQPSDTPADLRRALSAAADALRHRQNPLIVLIGDGAYPEETLGSVIWQTAPAAPATDAARNLAAIDLAGIDVRYVPVGRAKENVGIIAFNVRRYVANQMAYEVFIEVRNFGAEAARRRLILYSGDSPVEVRTLELEAGKAVQALYPEISGGSGSRLRAVLVPLGPDPATDDDANLEKLRHDAFPLDDEAFALLPERKRQDVLLVTVDNLYLEGAMLEYEHIGNIHLDKITPEEYEKGAGIGRWDGYHAVVFDDTTPRTLPAEGVHLLYFHPTGEASPFPATSELARPRITDVDASHPVMRWIEMGDVNFDRVATYRVDRAAGETALMSSVRQPIAAAKRDGRRKIVAFGFSLPAPGREAATDIVLRVAFPLLLVNALDWFAGNDSDLITTYATGRRIRVPVDGIYGAREASIAEPGSRAPVKAPIEDGQLSFYPRRVGVHAVTVAGEGEGNAKASTQFELATNLANPEESDIEPSAELTLGGRTLEGAPSFRASHSRSLWTYLVLFVLLLLAIEWTTYHRRVTV